MSDPTRLLEDPGTSPALKGLLASAQGDGPSPAELARLAGKLGALMVVAAPVGAAAATGGTAATGAAAVKGGTAVAAATGTGLLKLTVVAAVGGTVLAAGAFQAGRTYETTRPVPVKVERVVAAPVAPPKVVVEAAPVVVEPEPAPVPEVAAPVHVAKKAPVVAVKEAPPATEVELLEQAMASMGEGNSTRALELTELHAKRYPSGTLVQEREMLTIDALLKLGRRDEARKLGRQFKEKYPTSSHLLRLESLVGKP